MRKDVEMFAAELLTRRCALGISQADLARLINATQRSVSNYERATRTPGNVDEILAILDNVETTAKAIERECVENYILTGEAMRVEPTESAYRRNMPSLAVNLPWSAYLAAVARARTEVERMTGDRPTIAYTK
jgi:DNA-binding helix-turn-helix protein|nr:MAG TPA: Helix-turn-helix XRE-family like protein [Caudoviricetes sp.]